MAAITFERNKSRLYLVSVKKKRITEKLELLLSVVDKRDDNFAIRSSTSPANLSLPFDESISCQVL